MRIVYDSSNPEGDYYTEESFTISETAKALGRTRLTIRKWVQAGILPEAVFRDSVYMYHNYTSAELLAVVKAMKPHFDDFSYVKAIHTETVERVRAAVDAARDEVRQKAV